MQIMITLRNIALGRGQKKLLDELNWTIYHKQHIGIIGNNGSGKSSLFAMLLGEIQPDGGELEIPRQLKLAHVAQETQSQAKSVLDFVLDGDAELRALQNELLDAEQKEDGEKIAYCHQRFSEIDAYSATARAAQLLDGLGFNHQQQQQMVSEFSGGWRVRMNLAKALMCRSDVLLLDEPTNHLDMDAILWLERWLMKYTGTLLLISHDQEFLDHVVDHIAHISQQQLKVYVGNYTSFERQRAEQYLQQQAGYQKQQKQIAHIQSFINRFRAKASKARQAQSRLKALERMELISAAHADAPFQFSFREPAQCPNPLIRVEHVTIAYGEKVVLKGVNLSITPTDRIALLGPNGAGKSSFIKMLVGALKIAKGERDVGSGLKIGYFTQHQIDHLHLNETPLDHLRAIAQHTSEQELRNFLGSFAFPGTRILEPVGNFSGGEKSRLALALLVWQKPNLLLLDEPTNHLDLGMRHALSMALQEYSGAMILVSHDRQLVRSTVDKLMLIADMNIKDFDGDLDDYEKWLLEFRRKTAREMTKPASAQPNKSQQQLDEKQREQRQPLLKKIKQLEKDLEKLQKEEEKLELVLADLTLYEEPNKAKLQEYLLQQAKVKKQLESVEADWLKAHEEIEG